VNRGHPPRAGFGAEAERLVNEPVNFGYRYLGFACLCQVDAVCPAGSNKQKAPATLPASTLQEDANTPKSMETANHRLI
jgi:hypothetical protein